jgi:hypothetical protein
VKYLVMGLKKVKVIGYFTVIHEGFLLRERASTNGKMPQQHRFQETSDSAIRAPPFDS